MSDNNYQQLPQNAPYNSAPLELLYKKPQPNAEYPQYSQPNPQSHGFTQQDYQQQTFQQPPPQYQNFQSQRGTLPVQPNYIGDVDPYNRYSADNQLRGSTGSYGRDGQNPDYENNRDGTMTVNYKKAWNDTRNHFKKGKEKQALKDTQKQCCNPALTHIEEKILKAPGSTKDMTVFLYCFESASFEYDNYEPYKCNNIPLSDIASVLGELQGVENFRPELIKPNRKIVMFATIMVIL